MQCSKQEWDKLMKYISSELLKQLVPAVYENGYPMEGVPKATILSMPALISQEQFIVDTDTKREKRKVVVEVEYKEAWDKFWKLWPGTKSVPGTAFTSGAKMKGSEENGYKKWREAIKNITIEQMYYAANCYLQWGYEDSKRNGRNELLSRNGLEPWFNQKLYLVYMNKEMPEVQRKKFQKVDTIDI